MLRTISIFFLVETCNMMVCWLCAAVESFSMCKGQMEQLVHCMNLFVKFILFVWSIAYEGGSADILACLLGVKFCIT